MRVFDSADAAIEFLKTLRGLLSGLVPRPLERRSRFRLLGYSVGLRASRAVQRISSDASRRSYVADLGAKRDPNLDANGEDTTFCPTRTRRRERRKPLHAVRARTTDLVRTNTRKHWSLAEQIRCRAPRRERREVFSCERVYDQP
jgi:hypothetical protein